MINYTEHLTLLMHDIVARTSALSFIEVGDVLVFARHGRSNAQGAFATCHCLTLPPSEPGYYFWRERGTGRITRRSEWFITRSPDVMLGTQQVKYLISFVLPRFCDQTFDRSRKEHFYPGVEPWMAKLDTVIHELFHIDPELKGIRRLGRSDGTYSTQCHSPLFFEQVAEMVKAYLDSGPDPAVYDFLRHDFNALESRYGGIVGTTFRASPSYPQRYIERLAVQPITEGEIAQIEVQPVRTGRQRTRYTEDDLFVREFMRDTSRQLVRKGRFRAA